MGNATDYHRRLWQEQGTPFALASATRQEGSFMNESRSWADLPKTAATSLRVFLQDTGHGLLEVCHSSLALLGLIVFGAMVLLLAAHTEMRQDMEQHLRGWLQARHDERERVGVNFNMTAGNASQSADPDWVASVTEPAAVLRATALDPAELDRQQAAVAYWISRRYRVAPEPIGRLVQEAWEVGRQTGLDPTLILAIMAIESSFNPFAQSSVGAQGLMQVMTRVHEPKYEAFGGSHAAFDPVTNLRVGVQVLKECIQRAGSVDGGLKFYVGAANLADDGGYAAKVLAEQEFLRQVAHGRAVSVVNRPQTYAQPQTLTPESVSMEPPQAETAPALPASAATPGSDSAEAAATESERVALLKR